MFLHFGVNTFTNREWGDGTEDPAIFDPAALDARSWARSARAAGFRAMVLTAKHHDGFCLWPTRTTTHSVAASPFRGGQGDVVREFVDACRAEGLRPGLYCSPWDRNARVYGDSPRYNDMYMAQLTELLTNYGHLAEVWFDGANGEGPNGRHQVYDWPRTFALVRRLQPEAVMFSDAGPDVRWVGNESGVAGETCWSTIDPAAVPYPGFSGEGVGERLQRGDPGGTVWRPPETDVSIRPGWFWHPEEDARVRPAENLNDLYRTSVGRNSKLLLNVPPTRAGLLAESDVASLMAFRNLRERTWGTDLARGARRHSAAGSPTTALRAGEPAAGACAPPPSPDPWLTVTLDLKRPVSFDAASVDEAIRHGQRVAGYALDAEDPGAGGHERWREIARGTTIGYRKMDRFGGITARRVRLRVMAATGEPHIAALRLHRLDGRPEPS